MAERDFFLNYLSCCDLLTALEVGRGDGMTHFIIPGTELMQRWRNTTYLSIRSLLLGSECWFLIFTSPSRREIVHRRQHVYLPVLTQHALRTTLPLANGAPGMATDYRSSRFLFAALLFNRMCFISFLETFCI